MAAITTYDTLVENIIAIAEDDGTEFASYIPTAIDLAEERLIKECDFPELEASDFGTLTTNLETLPLPTNWKYIQYFTITLASGDRKFLEFRMDDYIKDYWPNRNTLDEPKYYGLNGSTGDLLFAPTPDDNYAYEIKYMLAPTKLSSTNQTNYFVNELPDVLFFACLIEIAVFQKAWSQVPIWEQRYTAARQAWNAQTARQRRDDGNTPLNPEGGQNNIANTLTSGSTA